MSIFNTKVAQYLIEEEIGRGSFSTVYKAMKISTKQYFALKQIKRNLSQKDVESIKNEIQILKSLNDNNIIKYYYDFKQQNRWFLVFEYCNQGDLYQFFRKHGQFTEYTTQMIIFSIAQALQKLHQKNIVHRDLKLANILINQKKQIKLADFGFSKNSQEKLMQTYCGTPITMAPEVIQRNGGYSSNCDTWSLGVIAYQMIFGVPPFFPENDGGLGELRNLILKKQVQFDEETDISNNCKQFLKKCLDKNMKTRPSIKQIKQSKWLMEASFLIKNQKNIFRNQEQNCYNLEQEQQLKQQYYFQYQIESMILQMLQNTQMIDIKYIYNEGMRLLNDQNVGQLVLYYVINKIGELDDLKIKIKYNNMVEQMELKQFKFFEQKKQQIMNTISQLIQKNQKNIKKQDNQNIYRLILDKILVNLQILLSNNTLHQQKLQYLLLLSKFISIQYHHFAVQFNQLNQSTTYQSLNFYQIKSKLNQNYLQIIKSKLDSQVKIIKNMVLLNPDDKQPNKEDLQTIIEIIKNKISELEMKY